MVRSLSNAFTLDDQLGLGEAVGVAWDLRGLSPSAIVRITIPVDPHETVDGAQVLVATVPFDELLSEYFAAPAEDAPK